MKKKSQLLLAIVCLLALPCILLAAKPQQKTHQQQARQILDATGLKGGLIVHLGCEDGRLTAALFEGADGPTRPARATTQGRERRWKYRSAFIRKK